MDQIKDALKWELFGFNRYVGSFGLHKRRAVYLNLPANEEHEFMNYRKVHLFFPDINNNSWMNMSSMFYESYAKYLRLLQLNSNGLGALFILHFFDDEPNEEINSFLRYINQLTDIYIGWRKSKHQKEIKRESIIRTDYSRNCIFESGGLMLNYNIEKLTVFKNNHDLCEWDIRIDSIPHNNITRTATMYEYGNHPTTFRRVKTKIAPTDSILSEDIMKIIDMMWLHVDLSAWINNTPNEKHEKQDFYNFIQSSHNEPVLESIADKYRAVYESYKDIISMKVISSESTGKDDEQ